MKRIVFKTLFVAAFTMAAGYSAYSSQQDAEMSDLALANVEALATPEIIRCTVLGSTVFYCKPNMMMFCYCDGARPGSGYIKTYNL